MLALVAVCPEQLVVDIGLEVLKDEHIRPGEAVVKDKAGRHAPSHAEKVLGLVLVLVLRDDRKTRSCAQESQQCRSNEVFQAVRSGA